MLVKRRWENWKLLLEPVWLNRVWLNRVLAWGEGMRAVNEGRGGRGV